MTTASWSSRAGEGGSLSRPELLDTAIRAGVLREAGTPSAVPLARQLASLLASWVSPLMIADDGTLTGREHGQPIRITPAVLLDLVARRNVVPQLGCTPSTADAEEAVKLAAGRARAEHERQAVADEHRADRARVELAHDVERAERRAALLRQLAALDDRPQQAPATPSAGWSRVLRRG
ncbi:hypothetical protein [Actinosynnema pretiosum]|uniref:Uncharacterized protein n=1 Tax=Actinosynnema pretiosum TaxID=42197 RepID=A0A290YZC3_9PSEU|nr:hypothetical protein [Actinosynnema pretiosum]ATE52095.1 hypothetical protein CNX65_01325 [Actinosynnema pretiosum]